MTIRRTLMLILFAAPAATCTAGSDPISQDTGTGQPAGELAAVQFSSGGASLNGVTFVASGPGTHPAVVLLHGFPGIERNFDVAHALRRAGRNVLVFHYRGAWGSEGSFSFANVIGDVEAALDYVNEADVRERYRLDANRVVLLGHGMGGFASLWTAARDEGVWAAGSIAGFNFGAYARYLSEVPDRVRATERAFAESLGPLSGTTAPALVGEIIDRDSSWDLAELAPPLAMRPLLLVAASSDAVAPPSLHHRPLVAALTAAGADDVRTITLNADHGFTEQRIALIRGVLAWLDSLNRDRTDVDDQASWLALERRRSIGH